MFSKRSFHALRHSFTSAPANQNVSSELRMKLTGHSTEGEHKKYTHHEMDNLRAAVEKSRPLADFHWVDIGKPL
jgi:integrase